MTLDSYPFLIMLIMYCFAADEESRPKRIYKTVRNIVLEWGRKMNEALKRLFALIGF